MMPVWIYNGWAAGPEIWELCAFHRDRLFSYIDELDGAGENALAELDGRAILVGFSMGGAMALQACLAHPEKIGGLVLISATARMSEERIDGKVVWRGMSPHRIAALRLGTLMTTRGNPSPLYAERELDRGLDYLRTHDIRQPLTVAAQANKFNFPVKIFQSERDGIVRPENATFLKRIFPAAQLVMVPGGEHSLPLTIAKAIDEAVNEISKL